jgi:hypothetical protein
MMQSSIAPEQLFGNGFGNFAASGGGSSVFGTSLLIPGSAQPGTPAIPASEGTDAGKGKSKGGGETPATPATNGTAAVPATPQMFVAGLPTGGGGGGFGFTFAGGIGNVAGDAGNSSASGNSLASGFGSAQGSSISGTAGGNGGGFSDGTGGGIAGPAGGFGLTAFNGTGGGLASGGAGGYVGFNPPVPVGGQGFGFGA